MMSLWDALRMNMMISYQELVRTFLSIVNPSDSERVIESVADLTFGEYIRLFENPELWKKTELQIDKKIW
ncbi:hypothetical protein ACUYGK_10420 [Enterobacter roggenkampii]